MPSLSTVLSVIIEAETQAATQRLLEVDQILDQIGASVTQTGAQAQGFAQSFNSATDIVRASMGASNADLEANSNLFRAIITRNLTATEKLKFAAPEYQKAWAVAFTNIVRDAEKATDGVAAANNEMAASAKRAAMDIAASQRDVAESLRIVDNMHRQIGRTTTTSVDQAKTVYNDFGMRAQMSLMGVSQALQNSVGILGDVGKGVGAMSTGLMIANQYAGTLARTMSGLGAAAAGIGAIMLGKAGELTSAQANLETALVTSGKATANFRSELGRTLDQAEKFGHSNAKATQSLAILVGGLKDPELALQMFGAAMGLAQRRGEDLVSTSKNIVRNLTDYSRGLKDLGIDFKFTQGGEKDLENAQKRRVVAVEALEKAQRRLAETEQRIAANAAEVPAAIDRASRAQESHVDALQRLQDVQDRIAARKADERDKPDRQYEAQQRSLEAYNRALERFHGLSVITQVDVDRLREAQRRKNEEDKKAATSAEGGGNLQEVNDRIALREANEAVAKSAKGLEEANNEVSRSTRGQRADALALKHAQEEVEEQQRRLARTNDDIAKANAKIAKQDAERMIAAQLLIEAGAGYAEAASESLGGKIKNLRAIIENWIAENGEKWGPAMTALGGGATVLGGLLNLAGRDAGVGGELAEESGRATMRGALKWAGGAAIAAGAGWAIGTVIHGVLDEQPKWRKFWDDFAYSMIYGAEEGNSGVGAKLGALPGIVWQKFQEVWTAVGDWGDVMYANMLNWGSNIIIGLYNGILAGAGKVWDLIEDMGGGIGKVMQRVFSFGSPSRVMAQYGRWISEGLADGIQAGMGNALASADMLASGAQGVLAKGLAPRAASGAVGGNGGMGRGGGSMGGSDTDALLREIRDYLANGATGIHMENTFNEKVDPQHLAGELAFQIRG